VARAQGEHHQRHHQHHHKHQHTPTTTTTATTPHDMGSALNLQIGELGHVFRLVELWRVDLVNIGLKKLMQLAVAFLLDNHLRTQRETQGKREVRPCDVMRCGER
jgi:hypothetical protein